MEPTGKAAAYGVLMFAASLSATAADQGFYFGAIGGRADYEFERSALVAAAGTIPTPIFLGNPFVSLDPRSAVIIARPPVGGTAVFSPLAQWQPEDDHESSAWGIVAGYRIVRYAAVELSYLDLGKLEESQTFQVFPPSSNSTLQFHRKLETTGPSVSALGVLPIVDSWSVYARAGVLFADMELTSSFAGSNSSSITFGSQAFLWGAGTQFDLGKHWSVRADFQRFDGVGEERGSGRADIDLLTLGVIFRL